MGRRGEPGSGRTVYAELDRSARQSVRPAGTTLRPDTQTRASRTAPNADYALVGAQCAVPEREAPTILFCASVSE